MRKGSIAKIAGAGIAGILLIALILALGYGTTFGFVCIVMWALAKLGVIGAWTYGQAALWALIAYVIYMFLPKPHSGKSND